MSSAANVVGPFAPSTTIPAWMRPAFSPVICPSIAAIPSHVAPISADVTRVAGDIFAILAKFLLGRTIFLVVAQVADIGSAFSFILANVPAVMANVTRVGSDVPAISMQVFAFRSHRAGYAA